MAQAAPAPGSPLPANRQVTQFTGSPDDILPQLSITRAKDAIGDQERKREGGKLAWFGGLGCVSLIGCTVGFALFPPLGVLLLLTSITFFVLAFIVGRKKAELDRLDLDNDRLALVQELITSLTADLRAGRPLALTLCHGEATEKGVKTEEQKQGNWLTGTVTTQGYEDDWLTLRGRLADGSIFRIEMTQETKRKSKPKRKYTKVTDRNREKVQVTLRVPPSRYPNVARIGSVLHPQALAGHVQMEVCGFQTAGNVIRVAARTLPYIDQQLRYGKHETGQANKINTGKILGMLAYLYGGLSHCGPDISPAGAGASGPAPVSPPPYVPPTQA